MPTTFRDASAGSSQRPDPLIYRHTLVVRATHWIRALCLAVLLMSGLQIFNAHPALYWGEISTFDRPLLAATQRADGGVGSFGVTMLGRRFEVGPLVGASSARDGELMSLGFPGWITLPGERDLATGRRWHFFFAWLLVFNGLVYYLHGLASGHWRDLVPTGRQLARIGSSIGDHLRLRFSHGARYNVLQKLSYLGVVAVLLPLMILTGLTMSPGVDAAFPQLLTLFGGRQSARTIHFIAAWSLVLFVVIHVAMVLVSGLWNNLRSMITGRYATTSAGASDDEIA